MAGCRWRSLFLLPICALAFLVALALVLLLSLICIVVGHVYFFVTLVAGSMSPNSIEDIALAKMKRVPALAKFATKHRSSLVIAYVLPMSLVFDAYFYLRGKYMFWSNTAPSEHDARVRYVQLQMQKRNTDAPDLRMVTARPGWLTISPKYSTYKQNSYQVNVDLYDVLELDIERQTVRVEPSVNMGQLTHTLLPQGYTIPVLPEMDDLTVGGMVCGTGIESSSHIHGLFQAICVEFEIAVADGRVLTASETENRDLFHAIPWSYGSLGFLLSVKLRVIPAKKYVRLEYHPFTSIESYCKFFEEQSKRAEPHHFIEGLVYSRDEAVIMVGDMVDAVGKDGRRNSIGYWFKPWFYKHVEQLLRRGTMTTEYLPLRDYYHRHTRSIFWEAQDIIPIGNNPFFRFFFGWMMPPKVSFLKLTQTKALQEMYKKQHVIQDMLVPVNTLQASVEEFDKLYDLYPLWLCPMRLFDVPGFVRPRSQEHMFVDIGAYGVPAAARLGNFNAKATGRAVEAYVYRQQGFQMLYADSYLSYTEFRAMFDHSLLDKLRKELDAERAFPEPFDKVCKRPKTTQEPWTAEGDDSSDSDSSNSDSTSEDESSAA